MSRSIRKDIENNGSVDFLSRPLLRTNPKLTTNIKLVVSGDDLYLESFDASDQLSSSNYKRFGVNRGGSYSYDVGKFWRINDTPSDLIYKVKRSYSDFSVLDSYEKQFEEFYNYGVSRNLSKLHNSDFRMLAPIWLDKKIPSKFLIYRTSSPLDVLDTIGNPSERLNKILSNSTLIKEVDLSKDSAIGEYIRNHVENDLFPSSSLTVSFVKNEQTLYNGIDLTKGGFVSKGEYHYKDTVLQDLPLIEYNKFVTQGFERNNVASANLINLEFLFDDDATDEFSINRYFGIYVDEHIIGEGIVESIKNNKVKFKELSHGLDFDTLGDTWSIPYSDWFKEIPMLGWVKSFSNYHNIKNGANWDIQKMELGIDLNGGDYSEFIGVKKTDRTVDVVENNTNDSDFIRVEVIDNPTNGEEFSLLNLKRQKWSINIVGSLSTGDVITLQDNAGGTVTINVPVSGTEYDTLDDLKTNWPATGTFGKYDIDLKEDSNGKWSLTLTEKLHNMEENHDFQQTVSVGGVLKIKQTYTPISVVDNTFSASTSLGNALISGKEFSANGSLSNIAHAISELINKNTLFTTIIDGPVIYIKSTVKGYNKRNCGLFVRTANATSFLSIQNIDVNNSLDISSYYNNIYTSYYFNGGSDLNRSVYIKEDDINEISVGEYLIDKNNNHNEIIDIVEDSRTINTDYKKLILKSKNIGIDGMSNVYSIFKMKYGLFAGYDMFDLNFDFYDTVNSELKELELESHMTYPFSMRYYELFQGATGPLAFNGEPFLNYDEQDDYLQSPDYFAGLLPILDEETTDESVVIDNIATEFDRLQENNTTSFATESRVVPYINKWCLNNTVNVRENPYYLNINEAFGETNFAPNTEKDRDKNGMTHEWFYLYNYPRNFAEGNCNSYYNYLKLDPTIELDYTDFTDINFDYFKAYFLTNGNFVKKIDPITLTVTLPPPINTTIQLPTTIYGAAGDDTFYKTEQRRKYTFIDGGSSQSFSSTVFKGIRFIPKLRKKQAQNITDKITREYFKNSEFNGYRFSVALKSTYNQLEPNTLKTKVIQNKKFKFVVLLLELNLSDSGEYGFDFLNRTLLYELDNAISVDLNTNSTEYKTTSISGTLDLSNVNLLGGSTNEQVDGIPDANGNPTKFLSQIIKDPTTGSYGKIDITVNGISYELDVSDVINDTTIKVNGGLNNGGATQPTSGYSAFEYLYADYKYSGGGIYAHEKLLEQLSIKNVMEILNNGDTTEYITVNENGTIENDKFVLAVEDGVEIIKKSTLSIDVDQNKPKSFGLSGAVIGYSIEERNEYFAFLTRQNGGYVPDMKPIVTFSEPFSMHKIKSDDWTSEFSHNKAYLYDITNTDLNELSIALYKKFNGCGIGFNVGNIIDKQHDKLQGNIKNYFFHKVNEINTDSVIKLSESDDLLPKYNLINEIAIDKRDINIFKSKWESDYYIRSIKKGGKTYLPGTKNIVEEKSYIGSAAMKIGDTYSISDFTVQQHENLKELNSIKVLNNPEYEVNYIETKTQVIADFYVIDSAVRLLDGLGVRKTINKYVTEEDSYGRTDTLDDDVSAYVEENILPAFNIGGISLYVKSSKKINTEIESGVSSANIETGGYEIDSDFTYELDKKNPLNFRLIYNKKAGYSSKIRPLIKIKS